MATHKIIFLFISFFLSINLTYSQIANGTPISIEDIPWQISTGYFNDEGIYQHQCGGSILNEQWILTAAHCSPEVGDFVHAGTNIAGDFTQGILVEIAEVIKHPSFDTNNPSHGGYDIALLRLADNLCFSGNTMQPVEIPSSSYNLNVGDLLQHSGYSNAGNGTSGPHQLRAADIPVISHTTAVEDFSCITYLNDWILPTSNSSNGSTVGDSGGPVVHYDSNNIPTIVGVLSWACYENSGPAWLTLSANLIELVDFVTTNITTPSSISMTTFPAILTGTYTGGPFFLDGNVVVNGTASIEHADIYVGENSSLTINAGANALIKYSNFKNCGNINWQGLIVKEGAAGKITRTKINSTDVGILIHEADNFILEDITLITCKKGVEIIETNLNTKVYDLTFVKSIGSPLYVTNASVNLLGCKFSESELHLNNAETNISETTIILDHAPEAVNLRTAFYNTPTNITGGSYSNMLSSFNTNSHIRVNDGDVKVDVTLFNVSHCEFDMSNLYLRDVEEWKILKNSFPSGGSGTCVDVIGNAGSATNLFEENVFADRPKHLRLTTEKDLEFSCNYHVGTQTLPYRTPQLSGQQGDVNQPAGNVFETYLGEHIDPIGSYDYYYDDDDPATYPEVEIKNGVAALERISTFVVPGFTDVCRTKEQILGHWSDDAVDLCPPEFWINNEDCYDICTLCVDEDGTPCDNNPRGNGGTAGKVINDIASSSFASSGSERESELTIEQSTSIIFIKGATRNANYRFNLYDLMGRKILTQVIQNAQTTISKSNMTSGIYIGIIEDSSGALIKIENILIP